MFFTGLTEFSYSESHLAKKRGGGHQNMVNQIWIAPQFVNVLIKILRAKYLPRLSDTDIYSEAVGIRIHFSVKAVRLRTREPSVIKSHSYPN